MWVGARSVRCAKSRRQAQGEEGRLGGEAADALIWRSNTSVLYSLQQQRRGGQTRGIGWLGGVAGLS